LASASSSSASKNDRRGVSLHVDHRQAIHPAAGQPQVAVPGDIPVAHNAAARWQRHCQAIDKDGLHQST
jgi:hypothetical protein